MFQEGSLIDKEWVYNMLYNTRKVLEDNKIFQEGSLIDKNEYIFIIYIYAVQIIINQLSRFLLPQFWSQHFQEPTLWGPRIFEAHNFWTPYYWGPDFKDPIILSPIVKTTYFWSPHLRPRHFWTTQFKDPIKVPF